MTLTRKQRKKRKALPQTHAGRRKIQKRAKAKAKKLEIRLAEEANMGKYLTSHGWTQCGPLMDCWKIAGWERPETCYATLRRAWRIQTKLESQDYQRPVGIDDDLGSMILGD